MKRYKIPETLDIREIPEHYIPISKFGCHSGDRPATAEYAAVRTAIEKGSVPSAIKFKRSTLDVRGQVFCDPADAKKYIDEARRRADIKNGVSAEFEDDVEDDGTTTAILSAMSATNDRIASAVERIAEALEMLATHPRHSTADVYDHSSTIEDQ